MTDSIGTSPAAARDTSAFDAVARFVQHRFAAQVGDTRPLFTVALPETVDLFAVFVDHLPEEERQHHTCHCCKAFFRRYGNLVVLDEVGRPSSALFGPGAPGFYGPAIAAVADALIAPGTVIDGVFVTKDPLWGTPESDGWTHFTVRPRHALLWRGVGQTPFQRAAALKEDHRTLTAALDVWKPGTLAQAVTLLNAEAFARSPAVRDMAEFLRALQINVLSATLEIRANLVWRAVATAPSGWASPRGSVLGTLLDDIEAGLDADAIKRRFDAKMDPLLYRRPQVAPAAGTLAQAEKLVAAMGIERSLERRFARLDEMELIWTPAPTSRSSAAGPVFGHLKPKDRAERSAGLVLPAMPMTWTKFARAVLPSALAIEVEMIEFMDFVGVVTATYADAPPIIQWDMDAARNPVSWYRYAFGSTPARWGLAVGTWRRASGVSLIPSLWKGRTDPRYTGAILHLDGARDSRPEGLGLFPEILKSSLHPVRSAIEAFSKAGTLGGADEASANGVAFGGGGGSSRQTMRVSTAIGTALYCIDRWD